MVYGFGADFAFRAGMLGQFAGAMWLEGMIPLSPQTPNPQKPKP